MVDGNACIGQQVGQRGPPAAGAHNADGKRFDFTVRFHFRYSSEG
jgi:hypothetical protein